MGGAPALECRRRAGETRAGLSAAVQDDCVPTLGAWRLLLDPRTGLMMLHDTSAYGDSITGKADCQISKGVLAAAMICCLLAGSSYQSVVGRL